MWHTKNIFLTLGSPVALMYNFKLVKWKVLFFLLLYVLYFSGILEAPRTFGKGFEVVSTFLNSVELFDIPQNCDFDELFGCRRCGVKIPDPCHSTCLISANKCLENVIDMQPLWMSWVDRYVYFIFVFVSFFSLLTFNSALV